MSVRTARKEVHLGARGEDDLRPPIILKQLQIHVEWTDEDKNEFIEEFWAHSNNPHKNAEIWRAIFAFYPKVVETRRKYQITKTFTLFRGGSERGFSWTTSLKEAEYFRKRNAELGFKDCYLWRGEVSSDGILFETEVRGEEEFVLRYWDETIWIQKPMKITITY